MNETSATASFTMLSPSTRVATRFEIPTRSKVAIAETGSVGATIAPSTKASAQLMLGMTVSATTATAPIVTRVRPSTSQVSGRSSARSSLGDAQYPADCRIGGRKTRKTTSGSSSRFGPPGMKPIPRPPSTRTIGYGIEIRSASRTNTIAAATSTISVSMSFTGRAYDRLHPMTELTPPLSAEDHVDGPERAELELVDVRRLPVPVLHGCVSDRAPDPRPDGGEAAVRLPPLTPSGTSTRTPSGQPRRPRRRPPRARSGRCTTGCTSPGAPSRART